MITWLGGRIGLGQWLIAPGSPIPAAVLSAAIAAACLLTGRLNGAVLAVVAIAATDGLVEGVLKPLVHRTYLGNLVYPSGHTAPSSRWPRRSPCYFSSRHGQPKQGYCEY